MRTIAITGASGFVGRHLVAELIQMGGWRIKVLSRTGEFHLDTSDSRSTLEAVKGDLRETSSLHGFFEPGCTVVNLVYLWNAGEAANLTITRYILEACEAAHVGKFIHCSTASVVGRTADDWLTEDTVCRPVTEYGVTKLRIEEIVSSAGRGSLEVVILRPTSVYGINGQPLKKLITDLSSENRFKNYLKTCLFGRRRMNLVHVNNVVAAIIFLTEYKGRLSNETFIVSDDNDTSNNFTYVENFLIKALGVQEYFLPRFQVPLFVLKWLLMLLGRNNVNPRCNFDSSKLRKLGFKSPVSLNNGLTEYATWYRALHFNQSESRLS